MTHLPETMNASVIRSERYGPPAKAFQMETIPVRPPGPREVVLKMMAAGVNYNNVWASLGYPVDVIEMRKRAGATEDFHVGGSEGSGIVELVGSEVKSLKRGDSVVVLGSVWDEKDPFIQSGGEPLLSPSLKAFGYETNFGTFSEYCTVSERQCLIKPKSLTWEEAATCMLCGATAYRMLFHWAPNVCQKGDLVLIWGAAGGLGVMAVELAHWAGANVIGIATGEKRCAYLESRGVAMPIDRNEILQMGEGAPDRLREMISARFGTLPSIVFEHPGEKTIPVSMALCGRGGMVVTCGGSSGYMAQFDLLSTVSDQKRLQGSHFADDDECRRFLGLVGSGKIPSTISETYDLDQTGRAHQRLLDNDHPPGNIAILIGAKRGEGRDV